MKQLGWLFKATPLFNLKPCPRFHQPIDRTVSNRCMKWRDKSKLKISKLIISANRSRIWKATKNRHITKALKVIKQFGIYYFLNSLIKLDNKKMSSSVFKNNTNEKRKKWKKAENLWLKPSRHIVAYWIRTQKDWSVMRNSLKIKNLEINTTRGWRIRKFWKSK